ncbi:MAG: peptidase M48 [Candidatus Hydrogenedentota bacterium]|nr:MAG: peptidase M48 [Candidatus Hydrogenedentota bacterium]
MKSIVSPLMCIFLLVSCATVPITGRTQLTLLPGGELTQMGLASYQQILSESTLSSNRAQVDQVRRVGQKLSTATESYLRGLGYPTDQYRWEFNLIDAPDTVNAFCLPGGKIAVYSGLLPIAQDDAGLATVMGHEIAHALAQHGNERMSQAMIVQMGGQALSVAVRNQPARTGQIFMQSYGMVSQVGGLLPFSRLHETEADRIGLTLMALAGYDPRNAVGFWERMNNDDGARTPQWLSTHPNPWQRVEQLKSFMPEALAVYNRR